MLIEIIFDCLVYFVYVHIFASILAGLVILYFILIICFYFGYFKLHPSRAGFLRPSRAGRNSGNSIPSICLSSAVGHHLLHRSISPCSLSLLNILYCMNS